MPTNLPVAGIFTTAAPHAVDPGWQDLISRIVGYYDVDLFFEEYSSSGDTRFRGFNGQPPGYTSMVEAALRLVYLTSLQDLPRYVPPAMRRLRHQMRGSSSHPSLAGGVTLFVPSTKFWRECMDYAVLTDVIDDRTADELRLLLQIAEAATNHPAAPIGTVKDLEVAAHALRTLATCPSPECRRELLGLRPDRHWQELIEALEPRLYNGTYRS